MKVPVGMNVMEKNKQLKQKELIETGGTSTKVLISSKNGRCNPIHSYSTKQLQKATNNSMDDDDHHHWFKAHLDCLVLIINLLQSSNQDV